MPPTTVNEPMFPPGSVSNAPWPVDPRLAARRRGPVPYQQAYARYTAQTDLSHGYNSMEARYPPTHEYDSNRPFVPDPVAAPNQLHMQLQPAFANPPPAVVPPGSSSRAPNVYHQGRPTGFLPTSVGSTSRLADPTQGPMIPGKYKIVKPAAQVNRDPMFGYGIAPFPIPR